MAKNVDCSSAPDAFHNVTLESAGVLVDVQWQWDGVSVRPDCDGPVQSMRVRNTNSTDRWAFLPNTKVGPRSVQIPAGTDRTLNKGQCNNAGLSTFSDARDVLVTITQPA